MSSIQSKIGQVVENAEHRHRPHAAAADPRRGAAADAARFPQDRHQDQRLGHAPPGRVGPDDPRGRQAAVPGLPAAGRRADERVRRPDVHRSRGQAEDPARQRGAVDLAYAMPDKSARFRVEHLPQPRALRDRHAADRDQDPAVRRPEPPAAGREAGRVPSRHRRRLGHDRRRANRPRWRPIIGKINRTRSERIITVEDPIEFQHENAKSLVSQVEVGSDSESYEYALRAMMRQDPDVILIGEIRDSFSLTTALRAADTGHLVFTTVHATNAPMTIERMVSLFDPGPEGTAADAARAEPGRGASASAWPSAATARAACRWSRS